MKMAATGPKRVALLGGTAWEEVCHWERALPFQMLKSVSLSLPLNPYYLWIWMYNPWLLFQHHVKGVLP